MRLTSAAALSILVTITACGGASAPTAADARGQGSDKGDDGDDGPGSRDKTFAPPKVHLIRYACQGFDAAVADAAPPDQLLSRSAARAVELGGAPVEAATRRWALLPPQGLLKEIERYEGQAEARADECAGLRAHLERMAIRSSSH
ncbi:hypothetical protein ENSA5_46610 [Enhygromyxa salina]|uniref:Lipoprotein n=1 Tax=Enhygromyxa salina TaxID=215803 RepID=A0A2S9XJ40_9BACT|nr:hypothetical protein [Enhygromyxa salina]PRP92894.1 hypothetical protein ENSA5_46610 [Enhygromyxa salina]